MATKVRNVALASQTCRNEFDGASVVVKYDTDGCGIVEDHAFALLLQKTCGHEIVETDFVAVAPFDSLDLLQLAMEVVQESDAIDELASALATVDPQRRDAVLGLVLNLRRERGSAIAALAQNEATIEHLSELVANLQIKPTAAPGEAAPVEAAPVESAPVEAAPVADDAARDAKTARSKGGRPKANA